MADLLNIWIGNQIAARGTVKAVKNSRGETVYSLQIEETIRMPDEPTTRRARRRARPRLLERFLDPDNDHPILRQLLQTFGPILMDFLTKQLPMILVSMQPQTDDEETA